LRRRPRPKLGCGAKERRRRKHPGNLQSRMEINIKIKTQKT
jgi:hypothetical protein